MFVASHRTMTLSTLLLTAGLCIFAPACLRGQGETTSAILTVATANQSVMAFITVDSISAECLVPSISGLEGDISIITTWTLKKAKELCGISSTNKDCLH